MSWAWQLMQHLGSVLKALQPPDAPVPSWPFKNVSLGPFPPVMEQAMCQRRNDHREQHQAATISLAQNFYYETGTDVCRQAGLQTDIGKNISGSW